MLDLDTLDLGDIADALADQPGGYEHLMLIDPKTGETVYWSADTGIDGHTPIGLDELLEEHELHEEYPDLLPVWYEFRDARATRRAVEWLAEESLVDEAAADRYLASHPDPSLPLRHGGRQHPGDPSTASAGAVPAFSSASLTATARCSARPSS